jgi:membrane-associated protease RseP (regulator of RpoE activity)
MFRAVVLCIMLFAPAIGAAETGHSKYAGQHTRTIKSLSADDIAELRRGGGWGLAKAAELNGVPGPAHLLELKDRIPLSADQVRRIEALHAGMKAKAIAEGEKLIALEARLENHFADRSVTDKILRGLLARIAESRRDLRYAHLATHLETPKILSDAQIARYNKLRGYGGAAHGAEHRGH